MAKNAEKKKKKAQSLRDAVRPFLNVPIQEEGHVWLYVGRADKDGGMEMKDGTFRMSHLHTDDFKRLKEEAEKW